MEKLAVHMRISGVTVSDDDVNSRRSAATSLATNWGKEKVAQTIVAKAASIAEALGSDGAAPATLSDEVQKAIQKKASSFLAEERPLDIGVCAGMAIVSMLGGTPGNGGWMVNDIYAAALWSALAYQPPLAAERRESLRREVLEVASGWTRRVGEKSRERRQVPNPAQLAITIGSGNAVTSNLPSAIADTVSALRRNSALDREELDFLWWALLGRSRLLKKQTSELPEASRIVAAGIEGAKMLRRFPSDVHREIILRTLDKDDQLDLGGLMTALGEADRAALSASFDHAQVLAFPSVFPLLHALVTGKVDLIGAAVKRPISEWGERALLEAGFNKMMIQGAAEL